jgi:antitoxin MazE7
MTATTIKVDTAVRDCLASIARARGITMAALLRQVCSELEARQEWIIIEASYERLRRQDPQAWVAYLSDLEAWDSVTSGLDDAASEWPEYNS